MQARRHKKEGAVIYTHSIALPDWGRPPAGRGCLRGRRGLHTDLGNEGLTRDDRTDLLPLRLDAMVTVGMDASSGSDSH